MVLNVKKKSKTYIREFLSISKSKQSLANFFFSIAILGCVDFLVFCVINSIGYLRYLEYNKDFKNGLNFKFWVSFNSHNLIFKIYIYYIM